MHGIFIVLDGPDGAGTTTHARLLAERLKKDGHDVLLTAEPTNGPIGTWIREHLKKDGGLTPLSLQLLFCADRAWHIDTVIKPALAAGKIVICDRYASSTLVYAEAQGMDTTMLKNLNNSFIQPDKIIFTLPPEDVSWERIASRKEHDLFEAKEMQHRIHDVYGWMGRENADISVVDTSKPKEECSEEIYTAVQLILPSQTL